MLEEDVAFLDLWRMLTGREDAAYQDLLKDADWTAECLSGPHVGS
jgi:hypothetical protein